MRRKLISLAVVLCSVLVFVSSVNAAPVKILFSPAPDKVEYLQPLVDQFNEENQAIQVEVLGAGDEKLKTMLAGGEMADIFDTGSNFFAPWVTSGNIMNLRPFIDRDPSFQPEDFFRVQWEAFLYDEKTGRLGEGDPYAVPVNGGPTVLYYNKNLFDQQGVAYPTDNWTWDDWVGSARKLTKAQDREIVQWGTGRMYADGPLATLYFVYSNGGNLLSSARDKSVIHEEKAVAGLQFAADLMFREQVAPDYVGPWGKNISNFYDGKLAMTPGLRSMMRSFATTKFDMDIAVMPKGPAGRQMVIPSGGFAMYEGTQHPEEAWQFLRYITSTKSQAFYTSQGQGVPGRMSAARSQEYFLSFSELFGERAMRFNITFATGFEDARTYPPVVEWVDIKGAFNTEIKALWKGEAPALEVCNRISQVVDGILTGEDKK